MFIKNYNGTLLECIKYIKFNKLLRYIQWKFLIQMYGGKSMTDILKILKNLIKVYLRRFISILP